MENLKKLVFDGTFMALSIDAGPLLLTVREEFVNKKKSEFKINFEVNSSTVSIIQNQDIFPFFNIQKFDELIGIGALMKDGVGRLFVSTKADQEIINFLKRLCNPCICQASHLLFIKFHFTGDLLCECEFSTLTYLQKNELFHLDLQQNYSISILKQRQRLYNSFKIKNDQKDV
jgi:hypothetical protein